MGTIFKANIADLIDPSFREIFITRMKGIVPQYIQVMNVLNSTMSAEREGAITDLPIVPEGSEGANPIIESIYQKYDKIFTHGVFKLATRITKEAFDDDLSGKLKQIPNLLAISAIAAVETACARHFDRAQSESYLGADGKPLCAIDHPNVGFGGTQSNRPTTNVDLSISGLEAGIIAMKTITTDSGIPMGAMLKPEKLVIPSNSEMIASRLLDNKNSKPGELSNDINAVTKTRPSLGYFVMDYITDTDCWFLLANKSMTDLKFFWREKISTKAVPAPDLTDDAVYKVRFRMSSGWLDWRGVYGSQG